MNKQEFEDLYRNFHGTDKKFSVSDWDNAINAWTIYHELIGRGDGLPLDRWLRNTNDGYLPDFLDTKEQKFGHARIGNYEQVMIYQYTGSDKNRHGQYRNVYKDKDAHNVFKDKTSLEDDYNTYIRGLLKKIVSAASLDIVFEIEKSIEFEKFSCKQILRKAIVLESLMDCSKFKNEFMWVYNEESLYNLAKIFEIDVDPQKTFLENNKAIYEVAKEYAGISSSSTKEDYIKLYDFLWYLSDTSFNTSELSDFHNVNLVFNGAPGTGKTYGVKKGIEKLQSIDSSLYKKSKYIQFHPSYTYQDFIEGIKPLGINSGNLDLQVVNGSFKDFCIKVRKENEVYYSNLQKKPNTEKPSEFRNWPHYYFVVDEINRGNLSNIFGETFTLLEYRDYDFSGSYSDAKGNLISTALSDVIARLGKEELIYKKIGEEVCFGIPFNIHFIGMMNDVDKSIDAFDLALRRRFKWIQKYCNYEVIEDVLSAEKYSSDNINDYVESCMNLNNLICDPSADGLKLGRMYEIGHAYFLKIREMPGKRIITKNKKREIFENYISGTLKEYIRQVADENEIDRWIKKAQDAFGI